MKLKTYFALSLLFSIPSFMHAHVLPYAQKFDGTFINGEVIRDIRKYQFDIKSMLLGKLQANRARSGHYVIGNTKYSVSELATIEHEIDLLQIKPLIKQMLNDFVTISEPFEQAIRDAKSILEVLVTQSNQLRSRKDSLLNKWSECSVNKERELLEANITTIHDLNIFLIDLCNFLNDIVESCPKARAQYDAWRKELTAK